MEQHDILVNTGITRDKLLLRMSEDDWDAVMKVNLKGVFNYRSGSNDAATEVRQSDASVVVGITGNKTATGVKAGVIGFTGDQRVRKSRVTVNAIAPGFIETKMTADLPSLFGTSSE